MPFVNEAQRRACWAKYTQDKKAGRKPKWDCKKWEKHTKKKLKSKFCGAKCEDGHKCRRKCTGKRCWQHE